MFKQFLHGLLGATIIANSAFSSASEVSSREYKLLLDASQFSFDDEQETANNYFSDFKRVIEQAIERRVSGALTINARRQVAFFDTPSSCQLRKIGYVLRERLTNQASEVTLKFRSPDRYISGFEDLSSSSDQAETKLEADIGVKSSNDYAIVYGHSTKTPNTRNINNLADINHHFPGFKREYSLDDTLSLGKVGGITVYERVYKGGVIDLGSIDAKVSLTLWYTSEPSGHQQPVIAEISFKYKDSNAKYTRKVVNRAKTAFESMQTLLSWQATHSITKTQFIYQYNPSYCE